MYQESIEKSNKEDQRFLQKQPIRKRQYKLENFKFRLPLIKEKGGVLLIVWNVFLALAFFSCATNLFSWETVTIIEYSATLALYPFIGLIGDCCIGRFKVLKASQYLILLAIILKITGKLIITNDYILYAAIAVLGLAGGYYISGIPYST